MPDHFPAHGHRLSGFVADHPCGSPGSGAFALETEAQELESGKPTVEVYGV